MREHQIGLSVSASVVGALAISAVGCDLGGRDHGIDASLDTYTAVDGDTNSDTDYDTDSDTNSDTCAEDPNAPCSYSFFVYGDSQSGWDAMQANIHSMYALDPDAIALFVPGDLITSGVDLEWDQHHQVLADGAPDLLVPDTDPWGIVRQSRFRTDVDHWGPYVRFVSALGNHDKCGSSWRENWNKYLVGQSELGINSDNGVYFTLTYNNAFFVILDSNHADFEQRNWLQWVLGSAAAAAATWKIVSFHHPVYPCDGKGPFGSGLPWVRLFEQHGVDLVFNGHSHTYERTCPMVKGSCVAEGEHGVIYVNTSGGGAPTRAVYPDKTATVAYEDDSDSYDCAEILAEGIGFWWHFCHLEVQECTLTMTVYPHDLYPQFPADAGVDGGGEPVPWDTLVLDKCE